MSDSIVVVLGGGGHARVLIDCLQLMQDVKLVGALDRDQASWGKDLFGVPILGDDDQLPDLMARGVNSFVVGLGSIGDSRPRQYLFDLGTSFHIKPLTVMHPTAVCSRWAKIGLGAQLLPQSVVNVGAIIGANVIINSGAIIEHDCQVGDHAHVATGARVAGMARIGQGAHIGAGATIMQGITVGPQAIVGAGAVVVNDVPAQMIVAGVPAKILRKIEIE